MLQALQQQENFDAVTNGLDDVLDTEWHRHRRNKLADYETVLFRAFVIWITKQTRIYLDKQNTKLNFSDKNIAQRNNGNPYPPTR